MKKRVKISDLKNHLSAYLRHVRRGNSVEVLDRDTVVARIVPAEEVAPGLAVQRARGKMRDFVPPPPLDPPVDVVELLREDRDGR